MKNLIRLTKTIAAHVTILSLLQTSFVINSAYAQNNMTSTEQTGKEILSVAQSAVGLYAQFLGQKQQSIMLQIQAQKNQQLMQTLSPSCRKPDGTTCYTVAGKYFPECPLPASMSNMPQNVCSSATPDPAQIAQMITYESIAKSWTNYFDQMLNEASNVAKPFGLKCLTDKQKALDSQLTEMVNNLTRLQDQLNKDKETFKANNKKLMEDLTATNDELMGAGGSGKNNLKLKTQDFAKYFSQSCQSIIGAEGMRDVPKMGLLGVMQSLAPANKRAADYNSNRTMIEAEVRNDIAKFKNSIQNRGLEDYIKLVEAGKPAEKSKYGALNEAAKKQASDFGVAYVRIKKELAGIGYSIPEMDKNFAVDFDSFLADSQSFFKKQYINDCVTGADKSGIAISTSQILNALEQRSTGSGGTARDKYRAALSSILNSDSFIQDKLNQIKELEATYQDISITYQGSDGQRVTQTPYDLYMKTIERCEARYTQNDQFSAGSNKSVSQKKKVERGQALLRELQSLHNNYASDLENRALEQVLSCNGESKKSDGKCAEADAFDYTKDSFCVSHANQCASEVNGCYAEATKHVETRKAKMEAMAKLFNANTQALVNRSNLLYNQQKAAVMDMIKVVQARFPGTNFQIPEGMFVSMPELKKDTFGVDLANDGNLAFMDELPKKIDLLKKVFKDQQNAVNKEIDDYIGKQTAAMNREKSRWEQLAGECKGMIDRSSQELAKMNNENMKKQGELDQKVGSFCRKYSQLQNNPLGACEDAKSLAEDADKISARLTNNAEKTTAQFRNLCNMYMNEKSSSSSEYELCRSSSYRDKNPDRCAIAENKELAKSAKKESEPAKKSSKKGSLSLASLCGSENKPLSNKELVDRVLGKLPEKERNKFESTDKLVKALKDQDFSSLDGYEDFNDEGVLADLANVSGGGDNVCKKLLAASKGGGGEKIKAAKEKVSSYEKEIKENSDAIDWNKGNSDPDDKDGSIKKARQAKLEETKKTLEEDLKKAKDELASAEKETNPNVVKIGEILDNLTVASSAGNSLEDRKEMAFNRLGEQIDGSCDAQASNVNTPKSWNSTNFLKSFDNAILGTTK